MNLPMRQEIAADRHDREMGGDSDGINGSGNEQKVKSSSP
jgi:hypothetical protein